MDWKQILKDYKIYVSFAVVAVLMMLLFPNRGTFQYQYQKGRPWVYETLVAPIDFPILKTKSQLMAETESRASETVDYYICDRSVGKARVNAFNAEIVGTAANPEMQKIAALVSETLSEIYEHGIASSLNGSNGYDKVILIKRDKRAHETPANEVYDLQQAIQAIKTEIELAFPGRNVDSICRALKINDYVIPDLTYDEITSEMLHKEAVNYISPTMGTVYTGQLIVSKGEIVTAEIEQLLDSYKAEYINSYGVQDSPLQLVISHIIMAIMLLALFFVSICIADINIFKSINKYIFLLMLFLLMFTGATIVSANHPGFMALLPFSLYVLYMMAFFKNSFVLPTYFVAILPILVVSDMGIELYMMNAVAGTILILSYQRFNRGWLQFVNGVFVFVGMLITYIAFQFASADAIDSRTIVLIGGNAILIVVCYPFTFLFERLFSLLSHDHLWELSDTNNPLLQELSQKAPSTFQHCLQVANLSENAARAIGADPMLVKVGSLYHDIGKIENPQCFIENQAPGINYHSGLTPIESAHEIIRHVEDGVNIAKKHHLHPDVIDFIRSHHARSQTTYFYNVYCNNGGDPEQKEPFTYNGILPKTKEQVIVMMADAVEAASRSLKEYSRETVTALVDNILKSRMSDDQLIEADISIREINIVKECLINYILQIYHDRIAYPARKKKE